MVFLTLIILDNSCSKSGNNINNSSNDPFLAQPQYDHNSGGIYKGVVVGSSGYFIITIKNYHNETFALLRFDSISDSLICPALDSYVPGSGTDIVNAIFTSALGTQDSLILSVRADGTNPSVKIIIPGHSTQSTISKETSSSVVKLYQGVTYDTLVAGSFQCGCGVGGVPHNTLGTIRVYPLNCVVQGNYIKLLQGISYLPSGCTSCLPGPIIIQINSSNQLDFNGDPGCSNAHALINVTDTAVFGNTVCPTPITTGTCSDAYNSFIRAVRANF
jgi:hypothetical protein